MPVSILLIEDDSDVTKHLTRRLATDDEHRVMNAGTLVDGLKLLETQDVDCVLLDYRLPDGDGLYALRRIRMRRPHVPVVMITGAGSEQVAVEAMKLGATDYVVKQGRFLDTLEVVLREALGRSTLRTLGAVDAPDRADRLSPECRAAFRRDGILGSGLALEDALVLADRAARSDVTVLLEGETGTGKELFARAIHRQSGRASGPFVAVNCAALPEASLEGELFGHVKGASSATARDQAGLFEAARGGTIFLDEVSEIGPSIQAKLLRVLQDGEMRPVGSTRGRTVDARVIAAAHDLADARSEGRFRADLYHRLRVFPLRLPPLRERREDVPVLAAYFSTECAMREGKIPPRLTPEAIAVLRAYDWPGNVRELENTIHRLVVCTASGGQIDVRQLPDAVRPRTAWVPARPLKEIVREVELATISDRLREHGYHRTATAESLGITREGLWQKLRQLGVRLPRRTGDGNSGTGH